MESNLGLIFWVTWRKDIYYIRSMIDEDRFISFSVDLGYLREGKDQSGLFKVLHQAVM